MKLGLNIINYGPGTTSDELGDWARLAEDGGFDFAMISDHVAITPDVAELYPAPFWDPLTTLAWLAGRTARIELGTTVLVVPFRHPIITARMVANIDHFSGGRIILGVGLGWAEREYASVGVSYADRGAIMDEYLAALRTLWTTDVATFEGRHVSFADVQTGPRPARDPHPPIWVGGNTRRAMRRAVTLGDGWHPLRPEAGWLTQHGLPTLREVAERHDRPLPVVAPRLYLEITDAPLPEEGRLAGHGSIDQIRHDVDELVTLGIERVVFDTDKVTPQDRAAHEAHWRTYETLIERV
ncbi:MAG TPA: TIGR03619 family F420-dependent LLM class oxidoreductase, partial [Capillimicrobium sp.]|nr:TIGR03619 family F420-dependent LLM class oxidoreductase [Capillimicrobium sp.]